MFRAISTGETLEDALPRETNVIRAKSGT